MPRQYALPFVPFTQVELTCQQCGVRYEAPKWQFATRVYCSRACRNEGRKTGGMRPCAECGTLFYRPKCKLTSRALCSNACKYVQTGRRGAGDPSARFWQKVDTSGDCWPRSGSSVREYSVISVNNRKLLATHYAWELASGQAIPLGKWVLHVCDWPRCVRADGPLGTYEVNGVLYPRYGHLWLGDHNANMADASRKNRTAKVGRSMPGEAHPGVKLTEAIVREIRRQYGAGVPSQVLAARHGVTRQTILDVYNRASWKHVE